LFLLRNSGFIGAVALLSLAACGGNDDPSNSDAGMDGSGDPGDISPFEPDAGGGDASGDAVGDGGDDADAGTGVDADDTGEDTDDGDASDTADTADVPPLDCDLRPTCADDSACSGEAICVSGECQVETTPSAAEFAGSLTLITGMRLGPPGVAVGLDLDGDGDVDNALGQALVNFPRGQETVERELARILQSGVFNLVTELVLEPDVCGAAPGTSGATIYVHEATPDLDADGFVDPVPESGVREVAILPASFSITGGPRCQLRAGSVDEEAGTVRSSSEGPGCSLVVPLPSGQVVQLPINDLTLEMPLPSTASEKDGESDTMTVAGSVEIVSIVNEANRVAVGCACAGIDTSRPIAETSESGGYVSGACIQSPDSDGCTEQADGQECANLENLCLALTVGSGVADVSSEGSGGSIDSLSFGFEATGEPVEMAPEPLVPDLVARGDHFSVNRNLDLEPGTMQNFAAVLINDVLDAESGDALLSAGFPDGEEEVLNLAVDGEFVDIEIPETFDFGETGVREVAFEYTIGSATDDTRRETAMVTLRLAGVTPTPTAVADTYEIAAPATGVVLNVLANDEAGAFGGTYIASFTQPDSGTVTMPEGQRRLVFDAGQAGAYTFTYEVRAWSESGGESGSATATVTLTVGCQTGFWGASCAACSDCGDGTCNDGAAGDGVCSCVAGYSGTVEGCFDDNECEGSPCDVNAACENLPGTYSCICDEAWEGDGFSCSLINECGTSGTVCGDNAACIPEDNACICASGFTLDELSGECVDFNECDAFGAEICGTIDDCTNSAGSFECACDEGSLWDSYGYECVPPNPCLDGSNGCVDEEQCLAAVSLGDAGGYDCIPLGSWVQVGSGTTEQFLEFNAPGIVLSEQFAMQVGFSFSEAGAALDGRYATGEGWAFIDAAEPSLTSIGLSPDGAYLLGKSEFSTYAMYRVTPDGVEFVDDINVELPFTDYISDVPPMITETHMYYPATVAGVDESSYPVILSIEWSGEGFSDWSVFDPRLEPDYTFGRSAAIDDNGTLYVSSPEYGLNGVIYELQPDGEGAFSVTLIELEGDSIQSYLGTAIAVSPDGQTLAALAPLLSEEPQCQACGTLVIFKREGGEWVETQRIGTQFGEPFDADSARIELAPPHLMVTFAAGGGEFRPLYTSAFGLGRRTGLYLQRSSSEPLLHRGSAQSPSAPDAHASDLIGDLFAMGNFSGMSIFRWVPVLLGSSL
jgi:hypothetical protein